MITIAGTIVAVAAAQWIVFALMSVFSRARLPKKGWRAAEKRLLVSTVVFGIAWLYALGAPSLVMTSGNVAQASVAGKRSASSCAAVTLGMSGSEVQSRLGKPDEVRKTEETRGPGASTWIYRDARCALHMYEGTVEFMD